MILMKKKLSKLPNQKSSATIQPHKNRSMRQFKWDHLHPHRTILLAAIIRNKGHKTCRGMACNRR